VSVPTFSMVQSMSASDADSSSAKHIAAAHAVCGRGGAAAGKAVCFVEAKDRSNVHMFGEMSSAKHDAAVHVGLRNSRELA